jgi:bacteriophage N4 adsorption protein B
VSLNYLAVAALVPLAIWILLSGVDDLFISLVFCFTRGKPVSLPGDAELQKQPESRIAIFVPVWKEDRVIGQMLERNLSVIRYSNYDVFVGVYPNDEPTIRAVTEAARLHPRVHLAPSPHNGPTSKGDCLNSVYRAMQKFEEREGVRFEIITTHDAEDLIHPDSLRLINWFSREYDMVQVPVLPLATGIGEFTHGIYCDEFAEFQTKDIPMRQLLGGFLPSNGVGTGFGREALESLADSRQGRIFDPECLTEDYENGYRLHELGCAQIFVPVHFDSGLPVATREYFPRRLRNAVRQRSRWVAGIVLQGWERHGWRGSWRQVYWWWRDRKGLAGNLLAPLTNVLFVYGALGYLIPSHAAAARELARSIPHWLAICGAAALWISLFQAAMRMWCCARIYGIGFAVFVPLRMLWGNVINSAATVGALRQFWKARRARRTLAWLKTDHDYPAQVTSEEGRPPVGEILVKMRCVSMAEVEDALRSQPPGRRIGEHLIYLQRITEENLYQALSSQAGVPLGIPKTDEVDRRATRALPAEFSRRCRVIPYRVTAGELHLLTPEVPSAEVLRELAGLSRLEVRFRLVRPNEFEALARTYLPRAS